MICKEYEPLHTTNDWVFEFNTVSPIRNDINIKIDKKTGRLIITGKKIGWAEMPYLKKYLNKYIL